MFVEQVKEFPQKARENDKFWRKSGELEGSRKPRMKTW